MEPHWEIQDIFQLSPLNHEGISCTTAELPDTLFELGVPAFCFDIGLNF